MGNRDLLYSENTGSGSATSSRTEAHSYTFNSANQKPSTDYWVFFSIEISGPSTTASHSIYWRNKTGSADLGSIPAIEPKDTTDYVKYSFFHKWTSASTPANQDFSIEITPESGTVNYKNRKIAIVEASANDVYAATDGNVAQNSTSYTDILSLGFTSPSSGGYFFVGHCLAPVGDALAYTCKFDLSSTAYSEVNIAGKDSTDVRQWISGNKIDALNGSQTLKIQAKRTLGTGSVNFSMRRILGLRLDAFENTYHAESRSESSTTSASYVNKLSNSFTPLNKKHLYLGSAWGNSKSGSNSVKNRWQINTTDLGESIRETGGAGGATTDDWWPLFDFYSETPAASAQDLNVDYTRSAGTGYIKETCTIALQTEGDAVLTVSPNDLNCLTVFDTVTITQDHVLSPNDLNCLSVFDSVTVIENKTVLPADLNSTTDLEQPSISQIYALSPNDLNCLTILDQATVTQNHVLSPADLNCLTVFDTVTVTQNHVVSPTDLNCPTGLEQPGIIENKTVSPADLNSLTILDQPTITQNHNLAPLDLSSLTALDSPSIIQNHQLSPSDLNSNTDLESPIISQNQEISPSDLNCLTVFDAIALTQNHILSPADLTSSTVLDQPGITENKTIAPNDLNCVTELEQPVIDGGATVSPNDLSSITALDSPSVTQNHILSPADLNCLTALDQPTVLQVHVVSPSDLTSLTALDQPSITQTHIINPNDSTSATDLEQPGIVVNRAVSPNDLNCITDLESPTISSLTITPNDLNCTTDLESPTVSVVVTISPNDLNSVTTLESASISQGHIVFPADLNSQTEMDLIVLFVADYSSPGELVKVPNTNQPLKPTRQAVVTPQIQSDLKPQGIAVLKA